MKLSSTFLFFFYLVASYNTDITTEVVVSQEAKSARVVESKDSVQVLMVEPGELKTGFLVNVPNPAKFILVKAQVDLFNVLQPTRLDDTTWYFLAPPGNYAVTVTQFDPEKGIDEQYFKVTVGQAPNPPPTDPTDPTDPSPGMEGIKRVAALAPKDVVTTEMLIQLYKTETDPAIVFQKRKDIMRLRQDQSSNWNPFILALNEELPKVDYVQGIRFLAQQLESRMTTTCINGVCYKTMK